MDPATTPLRVAMVSRRVLPAHGPGGLERHVFDLVTQLAARGVAIDLYAETPVDPKRLQHANHALRPSVTTHWIERGPIPAGTRRGTVVLDRITNYFLWSRRAARAVLAQDPPPTVVHVHGLAGWGLARSAGQGRPQRPIVLTPHGMEEFQLPRGFKRFAYLPFRRGVRTVARASAAIVATDRSLAAVGMRHLVAIAGRQVVIPNAIDPGRCRQSGDIKRGCQRLADYGREHATPLFLSVGRIEANKGFDVMTQALARVARELPANWTWVLVGDGPERPAIRAAIAAAGIEAHCLLPGRVDERELHSWYAIADWFVHPTRYEGSSLATLEAMAHACPVIASRAGGLPDKVEDGVTGFLVPPGDAAALARQLLAASAMDGRALGMAGRERCDAVFSWDTVAPGYVDLYRRLCA